MSIGAVSEQGRIWRLLVQHAWTRSLRWLHGGPFFRMRPFAGTPARLLVAPQDLRTADETNAADIYAGRFFFCGHLAEAGGRSPFELEGEHPDWQRELHSFGWLRDLRAADTLIARQNARALVDDWIRFCGRWHPIGWDQQVVSRRVLSWLYQSPLILQEGDHEFYRRFLRSLARQVRFLRKTINETPDGVPRLIAAMAIAAASIAMSGQGRFVRQSVRRLDQELQRQILPDGGHISRDPGAILEILADLLPIRQAFVMQGVELSRDMLQAVDRMMPMVRFFRHGDGNFAHFNGMGSTPNDLVATLLAYDDARGAPPSNAPHSGYQRLSGNGTVVLMDTGVPPEPNLSSNAHAGCLSMELSSGRQRIVVNCGVSNLARDGWRQVSRSTAAHSTVGVEDTSSCRFLTERPFSSWLGALVVGGPTQVPVQRDEDASGIRVTASHNGYAARFHVVHERDLRLARDGSVLDGFDSFQTLTPLTSQDHYTIRFHLHPAIKASMLMAGTTILLACPDGEAWEFDAPGSDLTLEESIYLSDVYGPRRTLQVVIYGRISQASQVPWQFRKVVVAKGGRRSAPSYEEEQLPLDG